jgi:hypothetical protein
VNNGERKTGYERNLPMFHFHVAPGTVQRHPGKGGSHFETAEPFGHGGCLANLEDPAAHSATSPGRMHKESSYLGRVVRRVEESILPAGAVITSKKRLPLTPTSATGKNRTVIKRGFDCKIGSIVNQLCIYTEDAFQGELQLLGGVVARLQPQNGRTDQFLKRRDISGNGLPDGEEHEFRISSQSMGPGNNTPYR